MPEPPSSSLPFRVKDLSPLPSPIIPTQILRAFFFLLCQFLSFSSVCAREDRENKRKRGATRRREGDEQSPECT